MRKSDWVALAGLLITLGCSTDVQQAPAVKSAQPARESPTPQAILPDGFAVKIEIAADDATRQQGLMYRESIAPGAGMIFLFPEAEEYSFWMKNTLIRLDMVWLARDGTIAAIRSNVPPCEADPCPSYSPGAAADGVLELGGGEAERHHLAVGQKLKLLKVDWTRAR